MGELVYVSFGGCGNRLLDLMTQELYNEHLISPSDGNFYGSSSQAKDYLQKIATSFEHLPDGSYRPRVLFYDSDADSVEQILQTSHISKQIPREQFVYGKQKSDHTWAQSQSEDLAQDLHDQMRKRVEVCDRFAGFCFIGSISGGQSGMMSQILADVQQDTYSKKNDQTIGIMPAKVQGKGNAHDCYSAINSLCTMDYLCDNSTLTTLISNDSLSSISKGILNKSKATYDDFNFVAVQSILNQTATQRFPGNINSTLQSLATNLVPYPRIHFVTPAQSTYRRQGQSSLNKNECQQTYKQMIDSAFEAQNSLVPLTTRDLITISGLARGDLCSVEFYKGLNEWRDLNKDLMSKTYGFTDFNVAESKIPAKGQKMSLYTLQNGAQISDLTDTILQDFQKIYQTRQHIHKYKAHGVDQFAFNEAEENLYSLKRDYESAYRYDYSDYDEEEEHIE